MKQVFTLIFTVCLVEVSSAQTTAMDFNMSDCATGQMHHLFAELDSGKAAIMEFFMTNCNPCVDAGNALEPMYQNLKQSGCKVLYYQTGFNDTYHCNVINPWVTTNLFSSVPFDSGAAQVAYYGGFGMPTVVVAAGSTHRILYLANQGFPAGDTATIADSIRTFCNAGAGVNSVKFFFSFSIFPKPASDNFTVSFHATETGTLKMELSTIFGEKIKTLAEEKVQTGMWSRNFSSAHLPKGIYFLRVHLNDASFVEKIIVE